MKRVLCLKKTIIPVDELKYPEFFSVDNPKCKRCEFYQVCLNELRARVEAIGGNVRKVGRSKGSH